MALACEALGLPVVSGNVSLYNEHHGRPIHPTPVVGVVGVLDDASLAVGAAFRARAGDVVLIAGDGPAAVDGSVYQRVIDGTTDGRIPEPDLAGERRLHELLAAAAERRLLQSAHDVSDGGIAVAIAESAMLGRIGVDAPDPGHPSRRATAGPSSRRATSTWRSSRRWPASLPLRRHRDGRRPADRGGRCRDRRLAEAPALYEGAIPRALGEESG